MDAALEEEIRELRSRFRSSRDPEGRAFAPLADAYRRAGQLEDAESLVDEGRERLPDFAPGHLVAGRILRERGETTAAARAFERVLELDPDNVEALREAAGIAESDGRASDALELYHRLSHLEPADDECRERIRELKRSRLRVERSAATDEREDEREKDGEPAPDEAEPAAASTDVGREAASPERGAPAAVPEHGEADEEDGDEVYTRTMAELYARQGLEERAAEIYRRLVERHPDDARLRSRLEELEARTGDEAATGVASGAASGRDSPGDPSIAAYFRRLLRWPEREAGAEEAAKPAASTGEIVPIEALAPDAPPEKDDDFRSWLRGMQR